jgi:flagellar biosynthesis GTPase FlhF
MYGNRKCEISKFGWKSKTNHLTYVKNDSIQIKQRRVMSDSDRNEILNVSPRNNNTFLHAPLNKKPVVEVSQNMKMPLFPADEGYRFLPENMDSYEITISKKIKGKYYLSATRTEKGELISDIYDPYDFTKADVIENFGKGTFRATLTGLINGQDERVEVWQRNIKINDGIEMDFACPDGVFADGELIPWDKYYLMNKEEEEEEEVEEGNDAPNKPLGGLLGRFGLGSRVSEEEEDDSPKQSFNKPSIRSPASFDEEEEERDKRIGDDRPSFARNPREEEDEEEEERDRPVFNRDRDRDRVRDFDRRDDRPRFDPRNRYDSRYSSLERNEEEDMPSWAKKLVEKKEEEKKDKPLIPPELVALAGTALTAIFTNMQESARRREEDERRRYEMQQEERRREYELRRADEERRRDEEKRKWEEERKREEQRREDDRKREDQRRLDEEKRRDEERRADEKRREEERRRYEEMKREEDRRADALKEEIRLERERIQREKELVERERIKMSSGAGSQALNPQIVEIMKQVDKLQEQKIEKMNNSGDLKSNLLKTVNEFKEVKDMLVDLGLAQPPEASSGGIEGFVGRVMQGMDPEKAAILAQAVFEKVGPMLGFGGQQATELPAEVDVS